MHQAQLSMFFQLGLPGIVSQPLEQDGSLAVVQDAFKVMKWEPQ